MARNKKWWRVRKGDVGRQLVNPDYAKDLEKKIEYLKEKLRIAPEVEITWEKGATLLNDDLQVSDIVGKKYKLWEITDGEQA